jgi:hypothetical protein
MSTPKLEFKPEDFEDMNLRDDRSGVLGPSPRIVAARANARLREMLENSEEGNEFVMVCYFKDENERLREECKTWKDKAEHYTENSLRGRIDDLEAMLRAWLFLFTRRAMRGARLHAVVDKTRKALGEECTKKERR